MLNLFYVGPVPDMTDSVIWVSLTKRTIKERTDETNNLFKENFLGNFLLQIFSMHTKPERKVAAEIVKGFFSNDVIDWKKYFFSVAVTQTN